MKTVRRGVLAPAPLFLLTFVKKQLDNRSIARPSLDVKFFLDNAIIWFYSDETTF